MSRNSSPNTEPQLTAAIVEQALQYLGNEASILIMQHIQNKYGIDFAVVGQYRAEFENYLRETFHESADIIIRKIRSAIEDAKQASKPSRMSGALFLFCDQCFWSASVLTEQFERKCMSCQNQLKCALPICENEKYSYETTDKRGVTLYFS